MPPIRLASLAGPAPPTVTPLVEDDASGDGEDMPIDGLADTIRFLAGPPKLVLAGPVSSPGEPVRGELPPKEVVETDRANGGGVPCGVPFPSEDGVGAFGRVSARWGCWRGEDVREMDVGVCPGRLGRETLLL